MRVCVLVCVHDTDSHNGWAYWQETILARGISAHTKVKGKLEVAVGAHGSAERCGISSLRALRAVRNIVGYMPQDDVIYQDLTVRENLLLSARYRLPTAPRHETPADHRGGASSTQPMSLGRRRGPRWFRDDRSCRLRVVEILDLLRLAGVADQIVGGTNGVRGISGGQRRRTSMGIDLVHNPSVFFLDEPTTGLDACSCSHILAALSHLSHDRGVTCVCIIHQATSRAFRSFDDLLLLQQGGRLIYMGETSNVCDFFEGHLGFAVRTPHRDANIADALLDLSEGLLSPYVVSGNAASSPAPAPAGAAASVDGVCDIALLGHLERNEVEQCAPSTTSSSVVGPGMDLSDAWDEYVRHGAATTSLDPSGGGDSARSAAESDAESDSGGIDGESLPAATPLGGAWRRLAWRSLMRPGAQLSSKRGGPRFPGFFRQTMLCCSRECLQLSRRPVSVAATCLIVCISGLVLGYIGGGSSQAIKTDAIEYSMIMIALLAAQTGQGVFMRDRQMFLREASSGLNRYSYFCARVLFEMMGILTISTLYTATYISVALPRFVGALHLVQYFALNTALCFYSSGLAMGLGIMCSGMLTGSGGGGGGGGGSIASIVFVIVPIFVTVHLVRMLSVVERLAHDTTTPPLFLSIHLPYMVTLLASTILISICGLRCVVDGLLVAEKLNQMFKYGYQPQVPSSIETLYSVSHAYQTMRGHIALRAEAVSGVFLPMRCSVLRRFNFHVDDYGMSLSVLVLFGIGFRVLSLLLLLIATRRR